MNLITRQVYSLKKRPLVMLWDTTKTSTGSTLSNQIKIPLSNFSGYAYSFVVAWGDGSSNTITAYNQAELTHTYSTSGIYTVTITGTFKGGFYFNNTGDRLKLTSITAFGDALLTASQISAFRGCENIVSLPNDMAAQLNLVTDGTNMFNGCTIFTTLPSTVTFASLTNGAGMFDNCLNLPSLPSTVTFASLTNGSFMFRNCQKLPSLPNVVTFASLTIGRDMFQNCYLLASLPSGVTFASLTDGRFMFDGCQNLPSLPSGITFSLVNDGTAMFRNCTSFTTLLSTVTFASLTNGTVIFQSVPLTTSSYSQMLVNINATNINTGVTLYANLAKYNTDGQTARNALTARVPAWVITDAGFEA